MHTLHTPLVPTPRMLKACALFGVSIARSARRAPDATLVAMAREVERSLDSNAICLIQGASGSGKSTLLGLLERRLRVQGHRVRRPVPLMAHAALVDQSGASLEATIEALASAGITEPALLVRPPEALSEGQRHRALLAITLLRLSRTSGGARTHDGKGQHARTRARLDGTRDQQRDPQRAISPSFRARHATQGRQARTTTLLIDEFTSTLDPVWAAAVARSLPHLLARLDAPIRVVVATSRPDLEIPGCTRVHLPEFGPAAA